MATILVVDDEALLALVCDNLTVNALRASKLGQTVSDEGVGMTEEQLARAFEPFYKADKARTRSAGGVGLGLSLAKRVAELHGATLTLHSTFGKGTAATFDGVSATATKTVL